MFVSDGFVPHLIRPSCEKLWCFASSGRAEGRTWAVHLPPKQIFVKMWLNEDFKLCTLTEFHALILFKQLSRIHYVQRLIDKNMDAVSVAQLGGEGSRRRQNIRAGVSNFLSTLSSGQPHVSLMPPKSPSLPATIWWMDNASDGPVMQPCGQWLLGNTATRVCHEVSLCNCLNF